MTEEPTVDRRIIRTKEAIRDALINLIEEKGFEAITVMDLTTRANINRGTFYLHYHDKYDLLEQIKTGILQDFSEMVSQAPGIDFTETQNMDEPLPLIVMILEYIQKHAGLMHAVLGLKGDIAIQTQVRKTIEQTFYKVGSFAKIMQAEGFLVPREYFISYVASAHLGVIQEWLQRGCLESTKEMALFLSKLSFYGPIYALGIGKSS